MQRYNGTPLGSRPHIAVLGSSKVGNFVVTLPLLQALRRTYPEATLDFWGSDLTADFETALSQLDHTGNRPIINWRTSWDSPQINCLQHLATQADERGRPDLLINCDGFNPVTQVLASWLRPHWVAGGSLNETGRKKLPWGDHAQQRFLADPDWDSKAFLKRYRPIFQSQYIAELLCRMAFVEPTHEELTAINLPFAQPSFQVPELLIHCTTTRSAKIWPLHRWLEVLQWCQHQGISVGLVGAPPARQTSDYNAGDLEDSLLARFDVDQPEPTLVDLRGKTNLIELAGACRAAQAVVSVDAGPLHIAAASGTAVMAVVGNDNDGMGASPIRLWLPRAPQIKRTISSQSCDQCEQVRYRNEACIADRHHCMEGVDADQVIRWLEEVLHQ